MKRLLILLCITLTFLSCEKDKDVPEFYAKIVESNITSTYHEINCSFKFESNGTIEVVSIEIDTINNFSQFESVIMDEKEGTWSATLFDLAGNTPYYLRFRMKSPFNSALADTIITYSTKDYDRPSIAALAVTDSTVTSLSCIFDVPSTGGLKLNETGLCYGTKKSPTKETARTVKAIASSGSSYSAKIEDLTATGKYYLRAYAANDKGITYSEEKEVTLISIPQVETGQAIDIMTRSAKCAGKLMSDGNLATITGVCYATSSDFINEDNFIVATVFSDGSFHVVLSNLSPSTTYFYRAYAHNRLDTVYGEVKSFKTESIQQCKVTTLAATEVTNNSAKCAGEITFDGGATITERGICYGKNNTPTIETDKKVCTSIKENPFTMQLDNLDAGTTYYFRAYAITELGTAYGEVKSFNTESIQQCKVTTLAATEVTNNSAKCAGEITSDGGATITARGICYGKNNTPSIETDKKVSTNSQVTPFTLHVYNLDAGTTYYFRAYAITELGTVYGATKSFTTLTSSEISITPESGFKSTYGSSEFTIKVNEIDFTVFGMMCNGKNAPIGLASKQLIQARKSSSGAGYIKNDGELNLKSITIATQNDKDFTLSAGVASDALSEVTKPTGTAAKYACKASDDTDTEIDVTVYTFNVTGMKYFELLNGSAAQYFAYIIIEYDSTNK